MTIRKKFMKCPFRTIRKVRYISYATNATKQNTSDYDETTEFAECLGAECPYYGKTVMKHRPSGGFQTVTSQICRRAENA